MGICWEGFFCIISDGCALVIGVGGIIFELFCVLVAGDFAVWDKSDFPGMF